MGSGVTDHRKGVLAVGEIWTDDIKDSKGNVLLSSDGEGHIDELSRMDAKVTSDGESFVVQAPAGMLVNASQSGSIEEGLAIWRTAANDTCYLFLDSILPSYELDGQVFIETITIYCYCTNLATDYITATGVDLRTFDFSAFDSPYGDAVDRGKDVSADNFDYTITVNTSKSAIQYWLLLLEVIAAARVDIIGVKIKYRLV